MQRTGWVVAIVMASMLGCGDANDAGLESQLGEAQVVEESFSALYEEVLVAHGCTSCHDAMASLNLSTPEAAYEALVGVKAKGKKCAPMGKLRVDPGNAKESLLVHKLEGHDADGQVVCGKPMPFEVAIADEDIARVRAWIDQGAQDN